MDTMAFDASGQLFGWSITARDHLVKIDKTSAAVVNLEDFTYRTGKNGLAFDNNGTMYLLQRSRLYIVNPETGEATFQAQYNNVPFLGHRGDIDPGTKFFYQTERLRFGDLAVFDLESVEVDRVIQTGIPSLFLLAFGY